MSLIYTTPIDFHEGEQKVQSLLHVPPQYNPTSPGLSPHATRLLHISSLLALGTLDDEGFPWTTLLGGQPGFARSLGRSIIGVKTLIGRNFDPVIELLFRGRQDGEVHETDTTGRLMSALAIHLETRDRVKLGGKMIAGAIEDLDSEAENNGASEVQAVFAIQQSLGNCPKYLNKKRIIPSTPRPVLSSKSLPLSKPAVTLLTKADMFFMTTSNYGSSMSTNHRGGLPGFVRVAKNDESGVVLIYPELSGNRLYQTLGNLWATPKTGLIFPDFDSGDALYITGTTEILFGRDAASTLPRSNVVVKITVNAARFVLNGLAFHGEIGERSPYNPPVRYLPTERALPDSQTNTSKAIHATLLARDMLAPTIARFRFNISNPEAAGRWKPGQYVALAFDGELSLGYSHMREDDPRSLNDDYIRTFTISSSPSGNLPKDEFEITIRNVGVVTSFLFKQPIRAGLEIPLKGFGGTFLIEQADTNDIVPVVAGGIGITPLLAQLPNLDLECIRLYWSLNIHDIGLAVDSFERCPSLAPSTKIFISSLDEKPSARSKSLLDKLERWGPRVIPRRMVGSDVNEDRSLSSSTWYLCASTPLRKSLLEWLPGKKTVYEDFDY